MSASYTKSKERDSGTPSIPEKPLDLEPSSKKSNQVANEAQPSKQLPPTPQDNDPPAISKEEAIYLRRLQTLALAREVKRRKTEEKRRLKDQIPPGAQHNEQSMDNESHRQHIPTSEHHNTRNTAYEAEPDSSDSDSDDAHYDPSVRHRPQKRPTSTRPPVEDDREQKRRRVQNTKTNSSQNFKDNLISGAIDGVANVSKLFVASGVASLFFVVIQKIMGSLPIPQPGDGENVPSNDLTQNNTPTPVTPTRTTTSAKSPVEKLPPDVKRWINSEY